MWSYGDAHERKDLMEVFLEQILATSPWEEGVLFPQPATHSASMFLPEDAERADVQVFDASGRQVWQQTNRALLEPGVLHLNIDQFANGLYILRVQTDQGTQFSEPLLVQRL